MAGFGSIIPKTKTCIISLELAKLTLIFPVSMIVIFKPSYSQSFLACGTPQTPIFVLHLKKNSTAHLLSIFYVNYYRVCLSQILFILVLCLEPWWRCWVECRWRPRGEQCSRRQRCMHFVQKSLLHQLLPEKLVFSYRYWLIQGSVIEKINWSNIT